MGLISGALGKERDLSKFWLTNALFQLINGGKTVQLSIFEANNTNLQGLYLPLL